MNLPKLRTFSTFSTFTNTSNLKHPLVKSKFLATRSYFVTSTNNNLQYNLVNSHFPDARLQNCQRFENFQQLKFSVATFSTEANNNLAKDDQTKVKEKEEVKVEQKVERMNLRLPDDGHKFVSITKWFKKEGDLVKENDNLCEIDTPDYTYDFQSELAGNLVKIVAKEGSKNLQPGETIAVFDVNITKVEKKPEENKDKKEEQKKEEKVNVEVKSVKG